MNVLQLCTSDSIGGAARACFNINQSLNLAGINSDILVQQKKIKDNSTQEINVNLIELLKTNFRVYADYLLIKLLTVTNRGRFTIPYLGTNIAEKSRVKNCDVINLHWINGGFLSLKSFEQLFKLNKPLVWTFHDMWGFTGGCHYSGSCDKYKTNCYNCPSLKIRGKHDLSNKIFRSKKELFLRNKFHIVTCSNWLANEVSKSYLLRNFPVTVIPNPIDARIYKPYPKNAIRKELSISPDKLIFLFSSFTVGELRKGIKYLKDSLIKLYNTRNDLKDSIEIIVLGSAAKEFTIDIPFKTIIPGRVNDNFRIAAYYSASDLFIAPSIQENLSNTVMESLSCGTPVLAFNIGGMPDMINHLQNGYLASTVNSNDLLDGMLWFINLDENTKINLCINARKSVVDKFSPEKIANKYIDIYEKLLKAC